MFNPVLNMFEKRTNAIAQTLMLSVVLQLNFKMQRLLVGSLSTERDCITSLVNGIRSRIKVDQQIDCQLFNCSDDMDALLRDTGAGLYRRRSSAPIDSSLEFMGVVHRFFDDWYFNDFQEGGHV